MRAPLEKLPELFGAAIRGSDWGDLRSIVIALPAGTDLGPLMKGLPDDLCSCPHWGYVIKGRMRVSYKDGQEEVIATGDLFYLPAGHTGVVEEEFAGIEFSPPAAHEKVLEIVRRNSAVTQTASA
jgi:uncharacterized protein DUF861